MPVAGERNAYLLATNQRKYGQMQPSIREFLFTEYGPIMDSKALCRVLHYPSIAALKASLQRGRLPCQVFSFPGRQGLFARTDDVAQAIEHAFGASASSGQPLGAPPPLQAQ